jgi:hypothetical protein
MESIGPEMGPSVDVTEGVDEDDPMNGFLFELSPSEEGEWHE